MSRNTFIFKQQGTDDRDCVKYIQIERYKGDLECEHYFPSITLSGACFSGSANFSEIDFDTISTILTIEEFIILSNFNEGVRNVGYGIKKGDERHRQGLDLVKTIQPILVKLGSKENENLFETIQEEEKEYLMNEFSIDEEDVDFIFNNYSLDYRDRGIVSYVFNDIDEASHEEAWSLGYVKDEKDEYFDYKKFGEDLLEFEQYLKLADGKMACLCF